MFNPLFEVQQKLTVSLCSNGFKLPDGQAPSVKLSQCTKLTNIL